MRSLGRVREAIQKSQRSPAIKSESSEVKRLSQLLKRTVAIGSIESQVDVAGEIMRHDQQDLRGDIILVRVPAQETGVRAVPLFCAGCFLTRRRGRCPGGVTEASSAPAAGAQQDAG